MKKIFLAVAAACSLCSCSQQQPVTVTVTNPLAIDRSGEMVEVSMAEISSKLQLPDTAQVIVLDETTWKFLIRSLIMICLFSPPR